MTFPRLAAFCMMLSMLLALSLPSAQAQTSETTNLRLLLPTINSEKGRQLFVTKGCVYCHSVNGVGGKAAPAFDSSDPEPVLDLANFITRMWRGAQQMIQLQEMDLGYQIQLTGEELAHIAGFASDPAEQKKFSEDQVPELMREWYLDEAIQAQ